MSLSLFAHVEIKQKVEERKTGFVESFTKGIAKSIFFWIAIQSKFTKILFLDNKILSLYSSFNKEKHLFYYIAFEIPTTPQALPLKHSQNVLNISNIEMQLALELDAYPTVYIFD